MSENIKKTIVKAKMSEYIRKPIVKILMLKGPEGKSIKEIKKTSTSGLVDTYTITMTDGTTSTFTVTNRNGNGISSIRKTGTSGLVDTYTITLTDGTKPTFTVTNGAKGDIGEKGDTGPQGVKGQDGNSIKEIKKASTSGLTDTYEISLTDGTKKSFTVSNGKGIKSIAKTSTSGLVDTYTITYNDGTTSTFTVKNGEKGDTGSTENLLNKTYPVGSIYMSVNSTDPSTLFGGTWERLKGRFLIGAGAVADTNSNTRFGSLGAEKPDIASGETGGEYYHQLNATEMPEHNHDTNDWTIVANKNATRISTNLGAKCLSTTESTNMVPNIKATKNEDGNRTGLAGGDGKHNNMPPYLAVYMWKRTA